MKKAKDVYHKFNPDPFHTHMKLLNLVKNGSNVLEIGCSTGYFSEKLVQKNCRVWAVEIDKEAALIAQQRKNVKVLNCDVRQITDYMSTNKKFDVILLADILEHLEDPLGVLIQLKKYLSRDGKILISLPNIANFAIRFKLFFEGEFTYQDYGILDRTHLRFFSKATSENLIHQARLKISSSDVVAGFEASTLYAKTLGRITFRIKPLRYLEYYLTKLFPGLFALEFIYEAKI